MSTVSSTVSAWDEHSLDNEMYKVDYTQLLYLLPLISSWAFLVWLWSLLGLQTSNTQVLATWVVAWHATVSQITSSVWQLLTQLGGLLVSIWLSEVQAKLSNQKQWLSWQFSMFMRAARSNWSKAATYFVNSFFKQDERLQFLPGGFLTCAKSTRRCHLYW